MSKLNRFIVFALAGAAATLLAAMPAFADNWTAVKLRGAVFALENGQWVQLYRGDVVSDARYIRTARNGRVQFRRENETIDLSPDTQIRIFDRTGQRYTVVSQDFGKVAVEAERRDVQHFAVQTRYLAAVVKGTRFIVSADAFGAEVDVTRGLVEARDRLNKLAVKVRPGQSAKSGQAKELEIKGFGSLDNVIAYSGSDVAEDVVLADLVKGSGNGNGNGNGNGGNGNGNGLGLVNLPVGNGNSGSDDDDDDEDGNGNSGSGNSGNGNSGNGNSGNGNSGSSNSGNGNSNVVRDVLNSVL